jgi:hypothetical protein
VLLRLQGNLANSAAGTAMPDPFAAAYAAANRRAVGQPGLSMSLGLAAPMVSLPTASNAAAIQVVKHCASCYLALDHSGFWELRRVPRLHSLPGQDAVTVAPAFGNF